MTKTGFEFWSLLFVCYLRFVIWNFQSLQQTAARGKRALKLPLGAAQSRVFRARILYNLTELTVVVLQ